MPILVLLLCAPLVEIAGFIVVGGWLTLWPTLGLVVASAVAGVLLLRAQGMAIGNTLREGLVIGDDPLSPVAQRAMILAAGVLLILPGFVSDLLALALLIAPLRRLIIRRMAGRFGQVVHLRRTAGPGARAPFARGPAPDWEDAEFEEIAPDRKDPPPPSGWTRH